MSDKKRVSSNKRSSTRTSTAVKDTGEGYEDTRRRSVTSAVEQDLEECGPGVAYMDFVVMEGLLDKLRLLNYELEFASNPAMKPFNRHYFAIQTNPGDQFYMFTSLAAWLLQKSGQRFEMPQESDDPNLTLSNILDEARLLEININFSPHKLKEGYGELVIYLLDSLANLALTKQAFILKCPALVTEESSDEEEANDEAELTLDQIEEDLAAHDSEEDLGEFEHILNLEVIPEMDNEQSKPQNILESNTNIEEWRLEVERVLPQLKVAVKPDPRDWRSHIEQMHTYRSEIQGSLETTQSHLNKLHVDIERSLEKITNREKYLNGQLEHLLLEFRTTQEQLTQAKESNRVMNSKVEEKRHTYRLLSESLDQIKSELEERSSSMTDGTPLVNIKKASARLRQELVAMDIRIGVLEHTLLQARLSDRNNLQRDMNNTALSNCLVVF